MGDSWIVIGNSRNKRIRLSILSELFLQEKNKKMGEEINLDQQQKYSSFLKIINYSLAKLREY